MKILLILLMFVSTGVSADLQLLIGTHDEADSEGSYSAFFNTDTGKLGEASLISPKPGTCIVKAGRKGVFYSTGGGEKGGYLKSFKGSEQTGIIEGFPSQPCYLALDKNGRYIFTSNISGESISSFSLNEDGSLKKLVQNLFIKGSGKTFKAHCVKVSPDNKFLYVADIGGKRICRIKFNAVDGSMIYDGDINSKSFMGPRHFIFGPDEKYAYLMNQMGGAVTVFKYQSENGGLKEIQHISSLPKAYKGKNHSAELLFHPNGKFLYCSNRLPDSITLFKRNISTGILEFIETVSSGGESPWAFTISLEGRFLLCSNKKTNNIVVYKINLENGSLTKTSMEIKVPAPVSLDFMLE